MCPEHEVSSASYSPRSVPPAAPPPLFQPRPRQHAAIGSKRRSIEPSQPRVYPRRPFAAIVTAAKIVSFNLPGVSARRRGIKYEVSVSRLIVLASEGSLFQFAELILRAAASRPRASSPIDWKVHARRLPISIRPAETLYRTAETRARNGEAYPRKVILRARTIKLFRRSAVVEPRSPMLFTREPVREPRVREVANFRGPMLRVTCTLWPFNASVRYELRRGRGNCRVS